MSDAERRLAEDRATRRAAKANLDAGVSQVKQDLQARSVPGRMIDRIKEEATETLVTGMEIAADNKPIVAAVAGGIGLWAMRGRIGRLFGFGRKARVQADDGNDVSHAEPADDHDNEVSAHD